MSTPAAHFEEALQSPAHAKSNGGAQDRAHGFMNWIWATASTERVPDEA